MADNLIKSLCGWLTGFKRFLGDAIFQSQQKWGAGERVQHK